MARLTLLTAALLAAAALFVIGALELLFIVGYGA